MGTKIEAGEDWLCCYWDKTGRDQHMQNIKRRGGSRLWSQGEDGFYEGERMKGCEVDLELGDHVAVGDSIQIHDRPSYTEVTVTDPGAVLQLSKDGIGDVKVSIL